MNYRKALLGLSIVLGVLVGGYLGSVYSEFLLGGALVGGLLGGLVYTVIDWAVSHRRAEVLPYDRLDEHQPGNTRGDAQAPEARLRGMQDGLMDDLMRFNKPKR